MDAKGKITELSNIKEYTNADMQQSLGPGHAKSKAIHSNASNGNIEVKRAGINSTAKQRDMESDHFSSEPQSHQMSVMGIAERLDRPADDMLSDS